MAHSGFTNKTEPQGKKPFSVGNASSASIGRLGFRVFFVALVFLVIPLMIHGWSSYVEDYHFRKKVLVLSLSSIVTGKVRFAEEMIQDKLNTAEVLNSAIGVQGALGGVELSKETLTQMFIEVAKQQNNDSVFFQEIDEKGEFVCTLSADPKLVGKRNLFADEQRRAVRHGHSVFLGSDPVKGLKEIFVSKATGPGKTQAELGTLTIGLDALAWLNWIALASNVPIPFELSLVEQNGDVFLNQKDAFDAHNAWLFTITPIYDAEELFQQISNSSEGKSYLSIFGKKKRWLGVRVPVPGTSFYLLAHAPSNTVSILPSSALLSQLFNSVVIFLVIGGGLALLITIRISRPFNALFGVMEQVERGNMLARYHHDNMGFEINALGHMFNRMIDAVIRHIEEARAERVAREILSKELKIGHDIQRSILPKHKPDFPGVAIATGFQGAQEVAGDFYDMFITPDQTLVCSIADAAGKGISACLYSLLVRSMLRSFARTSESLAEMLSQTNALFCLDTADSGNFVTAWVGMLDAGSSRLHYASCGHLPAILRRSNGEIEELNTPGIALGVIPSITVHTASIELKSGDTLVLFTDGITDSQDPYFELFGMQRLLDVIKTEGGTSAERLSEAILERVENFSQKAPLFDDRTLLVLYRA